METTTRTAGLDKDGTATFAAFARRGNAVALWWCEKRRGEITRDCETIKTYPNTREGFDMARAECERINMAATGREHARG